MLLPVPSFLPDLASRTRHQEVASSNPALTDSEPLARLGERCERVLQIHRESLTYFLACVSREPLLDNQDAVDLAGDTVATILSRYRELNQPVHYARTVRRNLLIRFLSRKRRRMETHRVWEKETLSTRTVAEPAGGTLDDDQWERLSYINRVLGGEDAITRLAVDLRHMKGLTYREIAEVTRLRPATVRMRIQRFRKRARVAWRDRHAADRSVRQCRTISRED